MRNKTVRVTALVLVCACIGSLGCGAPRGRVIFHDPNMDFSLVQTVAVMPFVNLTSNNKADFRVRDVFMTMLQATGGLYVLPPGEVMRGASRTSLGNASEPAPEEVVALAQIVGADAIITGTLREYGQVRSGSTSANVISISLQMLEARTGRVVWSASSTKGGIGAANRLFGGGGKPMDVVTEEAINDLLDKLFTD